MLAFLISCGPSIQHKITDLNNTESFYYLRESMEEQNREYPELQINTINQLNKYIDQNGAVVLAYFESRSTVPKISLTEKMIHYLVATINDSEHGAYAMIGHTHTQGSERQNMDLSIRRSKAVSDLLVNNFALDRTKIQALGEGEENPLNGAATTEDRRLNSRVELRKLQ